MNAIGLLPRVALKGERDGLVVDAALPHVGEHTTRETFQQLDNGRLTVRADDAPLWTMRGLTTVEAWMQLVGGDSIRSVVGRVTTKHRFANDPRGEIYLKRYYPLSPVVDWRERIRAWLKLQSYRRGAAHDWLAHLDLAALGIATATPVAFGASASGSFFAAESLVAHISLRDVLRSMISTGRLADRTVAEFWRQCGTAIGATVRTLHAHGLFHGDLYFDHFLIPDATLSGETVCVNVEEHPLKLIDLGRMRRGKPWGFRGVAKDLSQLMYSAGPVRSHFEPAFLGAYRQNDAPLSWYETAIRLVASIKAARIANHTQRHRL